jgi:hypothetical protein
VVVGGYTALEIAVTLRHHGRASWLARSPHGALPDHVILPDKAPKSNTFKLEKGKQV